MAGISLSLEGDKCWPDLRAKAEEGKLIDLGDAPVAIAYLEGGMASGLPSIAFRMDLPDGRSVFAQTSGRLFLSALGALFAKLAQRLEEGNRFGACPRCWNPVVLIPRSEAYLSGTCPGCGFEVILKAMSKVPHG